MTLVECGSQNVILINRADKLNRFTVKNSHISLRFIGYAISGPIVLDKRSYLSWNSKKKLLVFKNVKFLNFKDEEYIRRNQFFKKKTCCSCISL